MKKGTKLLIAGLLTAGTLSIQAAEVNPYNYSAHRDAINDAKLQLSTSNSSSSSDICDRSECNGDWNQFDQYIWADTNDSNRMYVSTNGTKVDKWRAEWRYLDSFDKSDDQSMKTVLKRRTGGSNASFTVAQLHMEDSSGPPARIEFDDGQFQVEFREKDGPSSGVDFSEERLSGRSGTKTVTMSLNDDWINILHKGDTTSFRVNQWPDNGDYYWKAGIYLQDGDNAKVRFTYIRW